MYTGVGAAPDLRQRYRTRRRRLVRLPSATHGMGEYFAPASGIGEYFAANGLGVDEAPLAEKSCNAMVLAVGAVSLGAGMILAMVAFK